MKPLKSMAALALLACLFTSGMALADRGHGGGNWHGGGHGHDGGHWHEGHGHTHIGIGLNFGPSFGPYYPYPYYSYPAYPYPAYPYYYPPVVVAPPSPPVYIEQDSPQQAESQSQDYYWYHCDKPDGYYPYIKACPGGWQKVVPEPPQ
ncbi:MAG: hypothetical protein ABI475_01620 [Methylophilaceae bacterium]